MRFLNSFFALFDQELLHTWAEDWIFFFQMVLLSFEDFQKIRIFPIFEGCGSKTAPTTPISILNFSKAWQSCFLRHFLEILITSGFFIDKKMMFYLEPVISMSPEHISVVPNLSQIKYIFVLPIRPIF